MGNFYEVDQNYKHLSYSEVLRCISFTETHVVLRGQTSNVDYYFPKHKRHTWIYKKCSLESLH